MKTKLTLLPRRSIVLPGESLPSFLLRLEDLNHYTPGTLDWLCRQDAARGELGWPEQDNVMRPSRSVTFAQLAALTGLTATELFAASEHHLAPTLIPPGEDQPSLTLPDGDTHPLVNAYTSRMRLRRMTGAQFCPLCLQKAPYHRLSWIPIASAACLQHHCLLVCHCPQCGKRVSLAEVARRECSECEVDLGAASVESVAGDTVGLRSQQWIQFWLGVAPRPAHSGPRCPTWPDVSPAALYRLIDGLRRSLMACQEDWPNLPGPLAGLPELVGAKVNHYEVMSPASSYHLYRVAFQAIQDWPHGFHRFLDAYSQRNPRAQATTRLGPRLGTLFVLWIQQAWRYPEFEFIQHAFGGYLLSGRLPLAFALRHERFRNDERLASQWGLLNWEQTSRILDIPTGAMTRSARSGCLRAASSSAGEKELLVFRRDQVLEIEQGWKEGVPLGEACHWLGLLPREIERLARLSALTLSRGGLNQSPRDWLFSKKSLVKFVEALDDSLRVTEIVRPLVRLRTAIEQLGSVHVDTASLLEHVAGGQLVGYKSRAWRGNLAAVYFLQSDLEALLKLIPVEQGWLTNEDIAQRMGVNVSTVAGWIHIGRITPSAQCGGRDYFYPDEVEAFCADGLTTAEAARALGMSTQAMMRKLVHNDWLVPIANPSTDGCRGYIFHRGDVEDLKLFG